MNILSLVERAKMDGISISLLLSSDVIVFLGKKHRYSEKSMSKTYRKATKRVNLQVNEEKTEYMEVRRRQGGRQIDKFLMVGSYSFKYNQNLNICGQ